MEYKTSMLPRAGKSQYQQLRIEMALREGKAVLVATPEGTTKQRRVGNVTLIENVTNGLQGRVM